MDPVRHRRIFYISGFDPRGPNHYHALYREQAAAQGLLTGQRLTVGPAERIDRVVTRWRIDDAAGTVTEYDFLRWDDLIRSLWHRRYWPLVADYVTSIGYMRRHGVMRDIRRLTWSGWRSMYFPMLMLAAALLAPAVLAAAVWWLLHGWNPYAAACCAAAPAIPAWWLVRKLGERLNADWVMRCVVFAWRTGTGQADGMAERTDRFAEQVAAACRDPRFDEIVVVGHSLGAHLAVEVLAKAMKGFPAGDPRLGFLTLGHTICLMSLMPRADLLRAELKALATMPHLTWVDVSAPPDRICFALCDPLTACGLPPVAGRPRLLPARFHRQFSPVRYKVLRENRYRIHFQYLMAAEIAAGFDYFRTTAGPRPLSEAESP